jgi:8-oxo-dGTP pyrophosphatase MutT (NUDIX family)
MGDFQKLYESVVAESLSAVFLMHEIGTDVFAATARSKDATHKDSGVEVAFPGGKVDPEETPEMALAMECEEKGWRLPKGAVVKMVHTDLVRGGGVGWFVITNGMEPVKLEDYKGRHRGIKPVEAPRDSLIGFGNEDALEDYYRWKYMDNIYVRKTGGK